VDMGKTFCSLVTKAEGYFELYNTCILRRKKRAKRVQQGFAATPGQRLDCRRIWQSLGLAGSRTLDAFKLFSNHLSLNSVENTVCAAFFDCKHCGSSGARPNKCPISLSRD
jgi:hypothetical protein